MFNVDFNNIITLLLPPFLRKSKNIAWLKSLVKPLIDLYTLFMAYRVTTVYSLSFTGQVIYLEKLLNDSYNAGLTGIYIADGSGIARIYFSHKSEGFPKQYLYHKSENQTPLYLYHKSEYNSQNDFIIMVPLSLYTQLQLNNDQGLNNMKSLVNLYKLAGKRYTINSY